MRNFVAVLFLLAVAVLAFFLAPREAPPPKIVPPGGDYVSLTYPELHRLLEKIKTHPERLPADYQALLPEMMDVNQLLSRMGDIDYPTGSDRVYVKRTLLEFWNTVE